MSAVGAVANLIVLTVLGAVIITTDPRLFVAPCAVGVYASVRCRALGQPWLNSALLAVTHGVFAVAAFWLLGVKA